MAWIDMRDEMHILMHGGYGSIAQAYWAIIRIFRLNEKTQYWIEGTNEAIGGPAYNYDDYIVRTISYPAVMYTSSEKATGGLNNIIGAYTENEDAYIFGIEYNPSFSRIPLEADLIYHINKFESITRPLPPFSVIDRFKLVKVFPDYGDNGRIEMIYCIGIRTHGES